MTTTWKFINKTTGAKLECNDMRYMFYVLVEERKYSIPPTAHIDLLLKGVVHCEITDKDGNEYEVMMGEHSPDRGIYFDAEEPQITH